MTKRAFSLEVPAGEPLVIPFSLLQALAGFPTDGALLTPSVDLKAGHGRPGRLPEFRAMPADSAHYFRIEPGDILALQSVHLMPGQLRCIPIEQPPLLHGNQSTDPTPPSQQRQ